MKYLVNENREPMTNREGEPVYFRYNPNKKIPEPVYVTRVHLIDRNKYYFEYENKKYVLKKRVKEDKVEYNFS